jgi:hypothetical protein
MTQNVDSWILLGLQKLNEYDRDHIDRLKQYAKENMRIPVIADIFFGA